MRSAGLWRHQRVRVLSLDVFDTALTRLSGPPPAVYLLLGNRLARVGLLPCTPEVFARTRHRAELDVWYRQGGLDAQVQLQDFYKETLRLLGLEGNNYSDFVEAELNLEARLLVGNPQAIKLVERCRARGWKIVFVSDTYFSAGFIQAQLERHNLWSPSAQLVASSDHPTSKASGGLFDVALRIADEPRQHVLHTGDNPHSDVAMPIGRRIRAVAWPEGQLNRYERLLADRMWSTSGTSAVLAGASRLARLSTPVKSEHDQAIRDVAAGVAAPFLVGYLLWVLRRASHYGLERVAFVARDGQVMASIAQHLAHRLGLEIECTYLYASRVAVNLAATYEANRTELSWVERDCRHLAPSELVSRLGLSWCDVGRWIPALDVRTPDECSDTVDNRQLFESLRGSESAREAIRERAALQRELVVAYLQQEGLLGSRRVGLVDFGGVGSQMRSLHTLISRAGCAPPRMFLVGLDSPEAAGLAGEPTTEPWLEDTDCYLYDYRRNTGVRRRRGFGTFVQMFCAADHGSVVGYRSVGDRVDPVLTEEEDVALIDWGLPVLRRTIDAFLEALVLDDDLIDLDADLHEAVTAAIDLVWSEPSWAEASTWGSFPFEGAKAGGAERAALAYRYTWRKVFSEVRSGRFPNFGWTHWFQGSVRLSGPSVRFFARLVHRVYRSIMSADGRAHRLALTFGRKALGREHSRTGR